MKSAREAPAAGRKTRDELAFLPAALEIVETPPSPTARLTAVLLAALFCCAVAWAGLGKIDIVASAPGKIVPATASSWSSRSRSGWCGRFTSATAKPSRPARF